MPPRARAQAGPSVDHALCCVVWGGWVQYGCILGREGIERVVVLTRSLTTSAVLRMYKTLWTMLRLVGWPKGWGGM